ncbi:hypothetical protein GLAREA_02080 [Glarea lozoyensis ATCC 20868]|uniref:Uncharacterized protein n=1 Tax=Glarea lozoyensis (strain ATCC 20868 / MF5171) TaxID=1116229 RepID=S3DHW8_GLAL2|nr:uncharacterized protein GLAREA_02080 [Glarea lozoyensis ATCC 20868]EPE26168.1 hypothetical protein GLAREA_02080 [Glarea lozoyensis ATCC 20868]
MSAFYLTETQKPISEYYTRQPRGGGGAWIKGAETDTSEDLIRRWVVLALKEGRPSLQLENKNGPKLYSAEVWVITANNIKGVEEMLGS